MQSSRGEIKRKQGAKNNTPITTAPCFAWVKVVIGEVVFKGRERLMTEEIQPQRGFIFLLGTRGRGKLRQA